MNSEAGRLWRGLDCFLNRWIPSRSHPIARLPATNLRLKARDSDNQGRSFSTDGCCEPELAAFLQQHLHLQAGDVVLDIGAKVGWFALLAERLAPPGVDIFAFESAPECFGRPSGNLRLNVSRRANAVQQTVSETGGTRGLHRRLQGDLGDHCQSPMPEGPAVGVCATGLDEFWRSRGLGDRVPRFAKIDIEACTLMTMHGGREVLARCPMLLAEFSPTRMRAGGLDPLDFVDFLLDLGFRPYGLSGRMPRELSRQALLATERQVNVVWSRDLPIERGPIAGSRSVVSGRPDSITSLPVTLLVIACNEAPRIGRCLDSVPFAAEKLVVDSGSTDGTQEVAERHGARVVQQKWLGFGPQRNFATSQASHDWILALDADEALTPELVREMERRLPALLGSAECAGAVLSRRTWFMGAPMRWYRPMMGERVERLYHRGRARWTNARVHEALCFDGPYEEFRHPFVHINNPTLVHKHLKTLHYAELKAQDWLDRGRPVRMWMTPLVYVAAFLKDYLLRLAFLDGWRGWIISQVAASYAVYKRMRYYEMLRDPESRAIAAEHLRSHGLDA